MILVLGFAPFIFSELTGYIKNGFLMGWAFSWALLADFFMAPAAIMLIKPLGKETGENK
jgi:predicted RND superfamily exporter protein